MPQEKRADSQECSTTQRRKSSKKEAHILLTECVLFFCFLRKAVPFDNSPLFLFERKRGKKNQKTCRFIALSLLMIIKTSCSSPSGNFAHKIYSEPRRILTLHKFVMVCKRHRRMPLSHRFSQQLPPRVILEAVCGKNFAIFVGATIGRPLLLHISIFCDKRFSNPKARTQVYLLPIHFLRKKRARVLSKSVPFSY